MQEEAIVDSHETSPHLLKLMFEGFLGEGATLESVQHLADPLPKPLADGILGTLRRLDASYSSQRRESRHGPVHLEEIDGIDQILLLDPQEQAAFVTAFDESMVAHVGPFYDLCHKLLDIGGLRAEQTLDYFGNSASAVIGFTDSYQTYLRTLEKIGRDFFYVHPVYPQRFSQSNADYVTELRQVVPRNMAMFTRKREPYDIHCADGCSDEKHAPLDGTVLRIKTSRKITEKVVTHLAGLLRSQLPNHLPSGSGAHEPKPLEWNDVFITDILGVAAMGHRTYHSQPGSNIGVERVINDALGGGRYRSVKANRIRSGADPTPSLAGRTWKADARDYAEGYDRIVALGPRPFTIDVRWGDWPNHAISALGANGHHRLSRASWQTLMRDETYGPLYEGVAERVNALLAECFFPSVEEVVLERQYRLVDFIFRRLRSLSSHNASPTDFDQALGVFIHRELGYDAKKTDAYKTQFSREMCSMIQGYNRVIEYYLTLPLETFFPSSPAGSSEANGIDMHTIQTTQHIQRLLRQAHGLAGISEQMYRDNQCSHCQTQKARLHTLEQNLESLRILYTDVIAFTDDPRFGSDVAYTCENEQFLSNYFDGQLKDLHLREESNYPELRLQHQIGLVAHLRALDAYTRLMQTPSSDMTGDYREALDRFHALRNYTTAFYERNAASFPLPARVRYQTVMARAGQTLSSLVTPQ
ncbi:hypothetical protein HYW21_05965 [Candidatus Woesearchaeota archaeon]|nr:hypothetical protein [Candidatus Woesearchaeota archaeon]